MQSLEPIHILFYYRVDSLALKLRRSKLRQVTTTNKMPRRDIEHMVNKIKISLSHYFICINSIK